MDHWTDYIYGQTETLKFRKLQGGINMVLNNLITKSFWLSMFEMYPKGIYSSFHMPWSSK